MDILKVNMEKIRLILKLSPEVHPWAASGRVNRLPTMLETTCCGYCFSTYTFCVIKRACPQKTTIRQNVLCPSPLKRLDQKLFICTYQNLLQNVIPETAANRSDDETQRAVDRMLQKASEQDKMILSLPKRKILKDVKELLKAGFPLNNLESLAQNTNILGNIPRLTALMEAMTEIGLITSDITSIVKRYPAVLTYDQEEFSNRVQMLQSHGFDIDLIVRMIVEQPQILHADLSQVEVRINDLKLLFKTKDTFKLLSTCPNLLFCEFSEIQEKFDYVFHAMGVTQPQMMYSRVFSYPIEHIHARHMFVVRAGFFKKVNRKQGQIDLNPKLDTILDTTDAQFAKKFGGMSSGDYQTFKKLLLQERVYIMKAVTDFED